MPKLYQKASGTFYTKTRNQSRQVVTLQITDEGASWLRAEGYSIGDELGSAFWELCENDWLYTLGELAGGGDLDIPITWIQHEALTAFPADITASPPDDPITLPCDDEFTEVPRFLYAPSKSIYYTILHVENSSDFWLEVPVLIKHRGAMELIRLGAQIGEEFTETGIRLLFERRWAYMDRVRLPEHLLS